jgi:hypothetical protein
VTALFFVLLADYFMPVFSSRLLSIAEETLAEFLSKATGTAVEWVQMPGMKVPFSPFINQLIVSSFPVISYRKLKQWKEEKTKLY